MPSESQRDDLVSVLGVIVLLIGTATGNALVLLGMSLAALLLMTVFYRKKIGRGAILVAFVAAVTATVIGILFAIR